MHLRIQEVSVSETMMLVVSYATFVNVQIYF